MRKVKRGNKPTSLINHAAQWTKDLLNEIAIKGDYSKVGTDFKNKYRQEDIKTALENMYTCHCCYCEAIIGISTYGRIEHLKPKSLPQFYQFSFDWDNLHWCCEICNTSYKKAQWDFTNPILDPSSDDIEQYLRLNLQTGEYEEINNNPRAKTTIAHTGLNREKLVKARHRIIIKTLRDYTAYKKNNTENIFLADLKLLKEDIDFPSLYDDLITYLSSI